MIVIAVPILMIHGVSVERINKICAASADGLVLPAPSRLLTDDTLTAKAKAKGKSALNSAEKRAYKFMGPVIK